jgi:acetoin utilization deacetylase AcuC-like enzyme
VSTGYALETSPQHAYLDHPEHPDRLRLIEPVLEAARAERIESPLATREQLRLIHTTAMIESLERECSRGQAIIDLAPTYVTRASFDLALRAAGGALECTRRVLNGDVANAFAIVRPPGHHAEPDRAMGFCLFNNVAIAASAALQAGLERVAIVDYDAHHGNGTQAAFLNEPRVAYLSTHQGGIYPGTGSIEDAPNARGRIVNVALPPHAGDNAFAGIADEIIAPFLRGSKPDLILVSAGFDAHWNDPLTTLGLSSRGFHALSERLVQLADEHCGGRIVFVLEGGYDPANVANGSGAVFAALAHGRFAAPLDPSPHREPEVSGHLARIRDLHSLAAI